MTKSKSEAKRIATRAPEPAAATQKPGRLPPFNTASRERGEDARKAAQEPMAKLPDAPVAAALAWLDKAWKWPLDRDTLVRGIVAAYKKAEGKE